MQVSGLGVPVSSVPRFDVQEGHVDVRKWALSERLTGRTVLCFPSSRWGENSLSDLMPTVCTLRSTGPSPLHTDEHSTRFPVEMPKSQKPT